MTINEPKWRALLKRLDEKGRTGLDLSPGDDDCRDAAKLIRRLLEALDLDIESMPEEKFNV